MKTATNLMTLILIWLGFQAATVAATKFDTRIIGELRDSKSSEKIGFANVIVFNAGDNGTLTLSVRDLFNTHKHENETFGDGFYSNSYFQFHRRAITLGVNYRINREKEEERERNGDELNGIEY